MNILLVEDDPSIAIVITAALEDEGLAVTHCETIAQRDALLARGDFSALVTDVMLPDGDGIDSLVRIQRDHPGLPVVILSAQNTLDTAVRASDTGAFEYFPKPFDIDELVRTVRQAVGARGKDALGQVDDQLGDGMPLVGRSQAMQAVFRMISRVLRNDLTVLVLGESGTGKELVAEAIHELGNRRTGPFVAVNAAAIPGELIESELFGHEKGAFTGAVARHIGKFEQAAGGTLFLDEIGDMPMQAQTRLLRALQSGTIRRVGGRDEVRLDVRIIAATNKDLKPQIAAGLFREDLYYRLNVVPIMMPPLRERPEDIEALARHFLLMAAAEGLPRRTLNEAAAALLCAQPWRGNVRELKNFMYRTALLARENEIDPLTIGDMLQAEQAETSTPPVPAADVEAAVRMWLQTDAPPAGTIYDAALAALERPLFAAILGETGGNQLRAATMLGINRNTLRKRLSELQLNPDHFASRR
jgi:two-component system, NtrC family, nitrogen regulation response regulator GlnG